MTSMFVEGMYLLLAQNLSVFVTYMVQSSLILQEFTNLGK